MSNRFMKTFVCIVNILSAASLIAALLYLQWIR